MSDGVMRGIFFGLLLSNLLYLLWQLFVPDAPAVQPQQALVRPEGERVQLVTEAPAEQLRAYPVASPVETVSEESSALAQELLSPSYCAQIGPFRDRADAETFIAANTERLPLILEMRQLDAPPDYRVYLPPFSSRELAASTMQTLRNSFTANNLAIDTYLIPRGELANGIALGLFSEQRNALNVQQQMEKLGYTVVVREEPKQREEPWVIVDRAESEAFFQQQWQQIRLSRSYIEAGEKLCETIAQAR
ncbi:MAG: SPOR domain-containing protein [Pseudomonadales bacterium]|nr:SPOR domain-containing protein [Pseudomonadales bacterium]